MSNVEADPAELVCTGAAGERSRVGSCDRAPCRWVARGR